MLLSISIRSFPLISYKFLREGSVYIRRRARAVNTRGLVVCSRMAYGAKFRYVPARFTIGCRRKKRITWEGTCINHVKRSIRFFDKTPPGWKRASARPWTTLFTDRRHGILARAKTGIYPSRRPGWNVIRLPSTWLAFHPFTRYLGQFQYRGSEFYG